MNTIFNNLKYFINRKDVTNEEWEHFYRTRWAHDTPRRALVCPTMSREAVRAVPATAGISTTPDA